MGRKHAVGVELQKLLRQRGMRWRCAFRSFRALALKPPSVTRERLKAPGQAVEVVQGNREPTKGWGAELFQGPGRVRYR